MITQQSGEAGAEGVMMIAEAAGWWHRGNVCGYAHLSAKAKCGRVSRTFGTLLHDHC